MEKRIEDIVEKLKIINTKRTIEEKELTTQRLLELEKFLEVELSEEYKTFMEKYANLRFEERISYSLKSASFNGSGLRVFRDIIKYDDINDYIGDRNRIPKDLIEISEGDEDLILLGVFGENKGKIFYLDDHALWDGEEDWYADIPVSEEIKYQHVYLVADSFIDFLQKWYVEE